MLRPARAAGELLGAALVIFAMRPVYVAPVPKARFPSFPIVLTHTTVPSTWLVNQPFGKCWVKMKTTNPVTALLKEARQSGLCRLVDSLAEQR